METTNSFLKSLSDNGVIDESNTENAIAKTRALLQKADAVWENAISKSLSDKIIRQNGQSVIDPMRISEARFEESFNGFTYNRPVSDLVQQGGGMYGIALAGYTYIMEKAGIRFYSLGGTSAGGINAMLLGTLPNAIYAMESAIAKGTQATKSELLAHIISNTNFSRFMDRTGIIGKLQTRALRNINSWVLKLLLLLFVLAFSTGIYFLFGTIFNRNNGVSLGDVRVFDYIAGTLTAFAPLLLLYIILIRVLGTDFGINTGNVFYNWIDAILSDPFVNVRTNAELYQRMKQHTFVNQQPNESAKMVLITSNLTHNRIVKFPEKANDYWNPPDNVNPAAYVRATMSIPFVFGTFIPSYDHVRNNGTPEITKVRFVDGGLLSNFPIREFHNNSITKPRFPTFGVLLNDTDMDLDGAASKAVEREKFAAVSLFKYVQSFLSTFRNFYDNDFLLSSDEIRLRVVAVDTKGYNWLDFWMPEKIKQELFEKGAQAAVRQLEKFEWTNYLEKRKSNG